MAVLVGQAVERNTLLEQELVTPVLTLLLKDTRVVSVVGIKTTLLEIQATLLVVVVALVEQEATQVMVLVEMVV
jgi:hypothetical protein